jgi:phosphoenolpyruvate synthase/pyruvate phosphate dikinase
MEIIPVIREAAQEVFSVENHNIKVDYGIGVQIEVPRACMKAKDIASVDGVDLISIDTKHLTEMMFGFSKEDSCRIRVLFVYSTFQDYMVAFEIK